VLSRYGAACVVCGVSVEALLDAAHIRGYRDRGSDDERNGIVLCASHHRAFDGRLFGIEPETTELRPRAAGPTLGELRITRPSLVHPAKQPHKEALAWRWAVQGWDGAP
jgi:putative restriction endonuclease